MKNENWHLLLSHCRYFDESCTEMFPEWSSAKHLFIFKPLDLTGCHGNRKANFAKYIQK